MNNYVKIKNFGGNISTPIDNPLSYCLQDGLNQKFLHGSSSTTLTPQSKECKMFMSQYCAKNWDEYCEYVFKNNDSQYSIGASPNVYGGTQSNSIGNTLLLNTAKEKYIKYIPDCCKVYMPFDPNVATSPNIYYWKRNGPTGVGVPVYEVDADTIDSDIVMNKILSNPGPYISILKDIYRSMRKNGKLGSLEKTKLGDFFKKTESIFI